MLPGGTVTFLFTDIAGSTARWESDPERMRSALSEHNAILESVSGEFGGQVFKTVGDAYFIAFSSAEDAARAALAAQQRLSAAADPLWVRMGLHTAAIQPTGGDYFGTPMNRVARILAAANPGQTLMSDATRALLPPSFPVKDLGHHVLRDLLEPARIWQLGAGDLGDVRGMAEVRNNLPLQTTSFVGREEELEQLQGMLDRSRLITLTGTGGTGKSRLALQFAAENMDRFPDGVWFVELAPLPEREDVLRAVAAAVGAPDVIGTLHDRLVMYLSGKRCLIILDNCEHVLDAASSVAEALVMACGWATLVATSREPLGARGEISFRVPSLPTPDPARKPGLNELERYGSTALFMDRLATAAPSYTLQSDEALTIARICNRLDGIPLAIELAAARGRAMTLQTIEQRLDDRFRLLTGGSRNALSRQQTLRALIDWSVQLLDDRERRFFISLSVFGGGWDIEAAETICASPETGLEQWEVLDLMTALVDKSLVVFDRGSDRYRLLESVRQYALERLEQDPSVFSLRDLHAACYLDRYRDEFLLRGQAPGRVPYYQRFAQDYENFRTAIEWVIGQEGGPEIAAQALIAVWSGFHSLGRPDEFYRLMNHLLQHEDQLEEETRTHARLYLGTAQIIAGMGGAYEVSMRMKAESGRLGSVLSGRWTSVIGYGIFCSGRFEESLSFAQESIESDRGNNPWLGYLFVHKGNSLTCLGRYDEALEAYHQALSVLKSQNDERGCVANLANICISRSAAGDSEGALAAAYELNARSTKQGVYLAARGPVLQVFGHRAFDAGDVALAAAFLGGSLGIKEVSGVTSDPVDRLGEVTLSKRLRAQVAETELEPLLEQGRRHDWEPFFQALADLTLDEVRDTPGVPLRHLTGA